MAVQALAVPAKVMKKGFLVSVLPVVTATAACGKEEKGEKWVKRRRRRRE